MKCDEARVLLLGTVEGRVEGTAAEAAREHVAACAACRELLAGMKADVELLRSESKPEVPAYLASRVMAELGQRQRRPRFLSSRAFARLAAVVLVGVGVWAGTLLGQELAGLRPSLRVRMAVVESEMSSRAADSGEAR